MQLFPTRETFGLALTGAGILVLGVALKQPHVVAFAAAVVLAVAVGRALANTTVARLRQAGFEMVWVQRKRLGHLIAGEPFELFAELRNRGSENVRGVRLRPLAGSPLQVSTAPDEVLLPAGGRVEITFTILAPRAGRYGVHGLALEVRGNPVGGEGLYEVPLLFANPFGAEVTPRTVGAPKPRETGGAKDLRADGESRLNRRTEGDQFVELREFVPGDPFRKVAWKASARRGKLVSKELREAVRGDVWLLVDASVDLHAGPVGDAPIDRALARALITARRHLAAGEPVGLIVYGARVLAELKPNVGGAHERALASALLVATNRSDSDRSDLDEVECARRVEAHLRPLDALFSQEVRGFDLDAIAQRAELLLKKAPFPYHRAFALTPREAIFRRYLAQFGIDGPARADGERPLAEATLVTALEGLAAGRANPGTVHVFGPVPAELRPEGAAARIASGEAATAIAPRFRKVLSRLRKRGISAVWTLPDDDGTIGDAAPRSPLAALNHRLDAARFRARIRLRRDGVDVR